MSVGGKNRLLLNQTTDEDFHADVVQCGLSLANAMVALE